MGLLRLLLAISVLLFHANAAGLQFAGGGVAVEAFFLISGFYMALILHEKYTGPGSYRLFISNRFLKLYPAYWTVLIAALVFQLLYWLFTGNPILIFYQILHYKMNLPGILFLGFSNIAIVGQDIVSFFGLNRITGELFFTPNFLKTYPFLFSFLVIPQGWSLGIELCFYLAAPFLVRRKWYWLFLLIAGILILRWALRNHWHLPYDPWIYRFFPSQLLLFLLGGVAYRIYQYCRQHIHFHSSLIIGITILVVAATLSYDQLPGTFIKKNSYHALVFLCLPVLMEVPRLFRFDNLLGELSYPLYLVHMLVLNMVNTFNGNPGTLPKTMVTVTTLIVSLLAALLINRLVVRPVDKYRRRRVKAVNNKPGIA
jgi:peptidoglycan/LPS O-acetylase OafA/YrhL